MLCGWVQALGLIVIFVIIFIGSFVFIYLEVVICLCDGDFNDALDDFRLSFLFILALEFKNTGDAYL